MIAFIRSRPVQVISVGTNFGCHRFWIDDTGRFGLWPYLFNYRNADLFLGLAPVITLTTDLIVGAAPPERAGVASAISETSSEFGGALGIAILGSIGTFIYRSKMDAGIPTDVPETLGNQATETLGGAVRVAAELPREISYELLNVANEAFVIGMQLNALIGAAIAAGLAFLSAKFLEDVKSSGH